MKRYLLLSCALLTLSFSTVVASISDSEFSLGGIIVGVNFGYVKSVYGEPDKVSAVQPGLFGDYYVCDVRYFSIDSASGLAECVI